MPKISLIVPVYNVGRCITKTIDSVICQTFKDFEVICVNDCSTDDSLMILEEFAKKDNRIKIINNKKNVGAALTRNVGIDNAKGKYIYFLDSDDYIDKKYLGCMVEKIEQQNCDIVLNLSVIKESGGVIAPYKHPSMPSIESDGEFLDGIQIIHDAPCFIWARMYNKSFLNEHNLRFINAYADDVVFNTITTMYTDKIFSFYGDNYHYVVHNSGMVGQVEASNRKDLEHIKAHSLIFDYLKEHNKLDGRLKLFRVYPFIKVDTEEKFNFYKNFLQKIEGDFHKNENIYNEIEKYFAYSLLNSLNYKEYLKNYNKVVTIGFLRSKR